MNVPQKKHPSRWKIVVAILVFVLALGVIIYPPYGGYRDADNPMYMANNLHEHLFFMDRHRHPRMDTGMLNGQASHNLYSERAIVQMQLGTYTNDFTPIEKGLPVLTLSNNYSGLQAIFRLDGVNQDPVLVLKNNASQPKMVMGIDLVGSEDPFLVYYDKKGAEHSLFGTLRR